jgi:class 3 adenylate cyclase
MPQWAEAREGKWGSAASWRNLGREPFRLPPMPAARRLAAILSADVAGYSRLMGADEEGTLAALKAMRRELADTTIAEHNGRIVKTTGDDLPVELANVVDAVRCAVEMQTAMAERDADVPAGVGSRSASASISATSSSTKATSSTTESKSRAARSRIAEAQAGVRRFQDLWPDFTLSPLDAMDFSSPKRFAMLAEALRRAGVPEA